MSGTGRRRSSRTRRQVDRFAVGAAATTQAGVASKRTRAKATGAKPARKAAAGVKHSKRKAKEAPADRPAPSKKKARTTKKKQTKKKKGLSKSRASGAGAGAGAGAGQADGDASGKAYTPVPPPAPGAGILFVFAHGAGRGKDSDWMKGWAARLSDMGTVHAFNYPYMDAGKRPPLATKNIPFHVEEVLRAQADYRDANDGEQPFTVLIGKSMGARISCHVAVTRPDVASAVVCLGYPLVGMNGKTRDQVLLDLEVPTLLCQGTRDRMSPAGPLAATAKKCKAGHGVVTARSVEAGDHGLLLTVKRRKELGGVTQAEADDMLLADIGKWLTKQRR